MATDTSAHALWDLYRREIQGRVFTDLTHAFHPGQPRASAFADEARELLFDFSKGHSCQTHLYTHVGQWGTHVDPPIHFIAGGRTLDQLPVSEMILPLVVIDISDRVAAEPDSVPALADLTAWEERHGAIPKGSFVALRTDWHKRWPDRAAIANLDADGVPHTPGWARDVLVQLFEGRGVTAVGHETTDTDPGFATSKGDYGLEHYILARDRWQIELLAKLDAAPEAGALLVASWPKPLAGSGYPARVFAIH
jgi:kynurenine formamidase